MARRAFSQLEGGHAGFDGQGEVEVFAAGLAEDGDRFVRPAGGDEGAAEERAAAGALGGTGKHARTIRTERWRPAG